VAFTSGVLTVSDTASRSARRDESGATLCRILEEAGYRIIRREICPDERTAIAAVLIRWVEKDALDLIVTTGGTGVSPRDVTPEATASVLERQIPGIPEAMRCAGLARTPTAMLSRSVAGVRRMTLIVNLPGSPSAVEQGMEVVLPALRHALNKIKGDPTPCHGGGRP